MTYLTVDFHTPVDPLTVTGFVYNYEDDPTTQALHCLACGRTLLVYKGRLLQWVTSAGTPYAALTPGTQYISHVCHHCHTKHNILLQTMQRNSRYGL